MEISARKIKGYMGANLWTQEQLAKAAGVSRATVNTLLSRGSCSIQTAEKIARAFEVAPADIIEMEEQA